MIISWRIQAIIWFVLGVIWVCLSGYNDSALWVAGGCCLAGLMSIQMED